MHKQVRPSGESGVSALTNVARQLLKVSPLHKKIHPSCAGASGSYAVKCIIAAHLCVCTDAFFGTAAPRSRHLRSQLSATNRSEVNAFGTKTVRVQLYRSGMGLGGTTEIKTRWRWRH